MSAPPAVAMGAALSMALALVLAGCGLGAGPAPTAVQLLVTRDFGDRTLTSARAPKVVGQETVMSLLMRNAHVATRFSGGFVESVDGVAGGSEAGAPVDWFYYVNGVQAPKGAAATTVHPGDHVWWDLHDWSQTEQVPAVVGSFPEPFLNGIGGKRLPVRVECESPGGSACRTVVQRLRRLGVPAAIAAPNFTPAAETLRVLVGRWTLLRGDSSAAGLANGPRSTGVYARFGGGGSSLTLLGADGEAIRTLRAGTGLVAATRHETEAPVWLLTGTDAAGVDLAARAFAASALDGHFALALSGSRALPLPASRTGG